MQSDFFSYILSLPTEQFSILNSQFRTPFLLSLPLGHLRTQVLQNSTTNVPCWSPILSGPQISSGKLELASPVYITVRLLASKEIINVFGIGTSRKWTETIESINLVVTLYGIHKGWETPASYSLPLLRYLLALLPLCKLRIQEIFKNPGLSYEYIEIGKETSPEKWG